MKKGFWKRLVDKLFVDKYNCIVCDEELEEPTKYGICPICMDKMPINDGKSICLKCGKHMRDEAKYCITCQRETFLFDMNRSAFIYKDSVRKLILNLKYASKEYLAKYLAEFYVDLYKKYDYNSDIVTAVPISEGRMKERGFNQAEEIAKVVAERLGLPYISNVVVKTKDLVAQEQLRGKDRIVSVLGAFELKKKDEIKGKNILLIDDVLTTGATMSAVAMELKKKCGRVDCLTFASPEVNYKTYNGDVYLDYEDMLDAD